jgi:hypothetical protein
VKHNRYDQTLARQGQNNHAITRDGGLKVKKVQKALEKFKLPNGHVL